MKQYILLVCGPLCSGKSTLGGVFLKKEPRLFRASFDMMKQNISDFDAEKDRMLVKDLSFSLSKDVIDKGLSIIVEGSANILFEMREFYKNLAQEKQIVFLEVNLEAPLEVLLKRLEERVATGKTLTVTRPEQLIQRYNVYLERKDKTASTYITTDATPEELYLSVVKELKSKK